MTGFGIKTTKHQQRYWQNRKLDWKAEIDLTWNHPHRNIISHFLKRLNWFSLIEIGCGAGANLANIVRNIPNRQLGGVDLNADAIAYASKRFEGGMFKVDSGEDIMMSDKSCDVVLSDMMLIYIGPNKIKRYLAEMKRIGRKYVVFCELHSTSFWKRLWLRLTSGYNAYNYKKLLDKVGFYDVLYYKLRPEDWDGFEPQRSYAHIFIARIIN